MSQTTFTLENHKELFRDAASYEQFVNALRDAAREDFALMFADHEILGAVLSARATKKVLCDRMVQSIAKDPGILSEMTDRIKNDPIVD